jgi:hypothetical protein
MSRVTRKTRHFHFFAVQGRMRRSNYIIYRINYKYWISFNHLELIGFSLFPGKFIEMTRFTRDA